MELTCAYYVSLISGRNDLILNHDRIPIHNSERANRVDEDCFGKIDVRATGTILYRMGYWLKDRHEGIVCGCNIFLYLLSVITRS
jgi:hypothetical protein